jgi:hypothetical protein
MIDLDVWLDANNPTEGAKWTLAEARGISNTGWITGTGSYDPDGPGGVAAANRAYLLDASSLVLQLPGDFNHDGTVDAADYVVWRKNDGGLQAYDTWRANFGSSLGPGSGSALPSAEPLSANVPEPSSLALLTLAMAAILRRRRSRPRPTAQLW